MHIGYILFLIGMILGGAAFADDRDHDRALRAVEDGRILPLKSILDRALVDFPGQMIEAELEDEGGKLVYEITILSVEGRVLKVLYDAQSGTLLKAKSRDGKR